MPRKKIGDPAVGVPRRVTQQDIANIAGVHKVTVSDALKGTGRVDPSTREKIHQIARELNYVPNLAARALATGQTGNIVLLGGPIYEIYYARMAYNLETLINAAGYQLILVRTADKVKDLLNSNSGLSADGVIVIDVIRLLEEFRTPPAIPCVSICTRKHDFIDNVIADISESLKYAILLMYEAGRRRIAYIVTCDMMAEEAEIRASTYYLAMRSTNLSQEVINLNSDDPAIAEIRLERYIRENGCPEGLVCQNDEVAICALSVVKRLGYKVPDDVMLVGCDGQPHMKHFDPPLSTIEQPMEQMCTIAWQFLKRRMADMSIPHQHVALHGHLILTQSLVPTMGQELLKRQ